jgi:hypothetical protein
LLIGGNFTTMPAPIILQLVECGLLAARRGIGPEIDHGIEEYGARTAEGIPGRQPKGSSHRGWLQPL